MKYVATIGVLLGAVTARASAQGVTPTIHLEGGLDLALGENAEPFDLGGAYAIRAGLEVVGPLAVQVSFFNAWFPVEGEDPGNLYAFEIGARAFFRLGETVGGPFVDFNAGVGVTGDLTRFVFDAGLGWDFFVHNYVGLGPVVRYQQIVQPDNENARDDAFLLSFGINLTLRFERDPPPPPEPVLPPLPPEPVDSDGDGIDDDDDRCVSVPEDMDQFEDEDGCPELDNDRDGLPDDVDRCPLEAEVRNDFQDEDGCPDEAPPVVIRERDEGELLPQQVLFRVGTDRVSPRFRGEIAAVCELLQANPDARLRVIGHADEQGTAAGNHRLGAQRAGAVAEQLVICGVSPTRLESRSYGDTRLVCEDDEVDCHLRNRRVQMRLLPPE